MREYTFWKWYRSYNPKMDPDTDDMIDELRSCWYTAWERSRRVCQALQELSELGQDFDNGQPKP